jgi:integral membrane protein
VPTNPFSQLHWAGVAEGISYLFLLGVAVPMKYIGGNAVLVKIVGPIHGALFVLFCLLALRAWDKGSWKMSQAAKVFATSLIPFGWLLISKFLKAEEGKGI